MSFSPLPRRCSSAMTSAHGVVARAAPAEPSREALSSTSTSVSNGRRLALGRDGVQAAHEQLALLGVDDAEGELDSHRCAYCHRSDARQRRRSRRLHAALRPRAVRRAGRGGGRRRARHDAASPHGEVPPRAAATRCARTSTAARPSGRGAALRRGWPSTSPTCCAPSRARAPTSCTSSGWRCSRSTRTCCAPTAARACITAHDVLPREPRAGPARRPAPALRAHGRDRRAHRARARRGWSTSSACRRKRVHVIPHGDPAPAPATRAAAARAARDYDGTVVLCFGLLRPYKGIDVLLEAWRGDRGRRAVDRRRAADGHRAAARARRRRACASSSASSATARRRRSSAAPTSPCCPTARSSSRASSSRRSAFGVPLRAHRRRRLPRGRRAPARPSSSRPATPPRCTTRSRRLLADPARRAALADGARCASPTRRTAGTRSRAPTSSSTSSLLR